MGIGLLGLVVLPSWTLGQVNTTPKPTQSAPIDRDKQLQTLEYQLQGVLTDLESQRKAPPSSAATPVLAGDRLYSVAFADTGTVKSADRDKKLQDLETRLKELLKEVQALRTSADAKPPRPAKAHLEYKPSQVQIALDWGFFLTKAGPAPVVLGLAPATSSEVTLIRSTYKLPAAKAEALGTFLQQHVKAAAIETKVEGESLIVTTTPEVQRGISQFVGLMVGKVPQATTKPQWNRSGQPGQQAGPQSR